MTAPSMTWLSGCASLCLHEGLHLPGILSDRDGTQVAMATPMARELGLMALATFAAIAIGAVACAPGEAGPAPEIAQARPPAPGTCSEWHGQPIDRSCLPRMAKAGAPLVLEIEERCGACGATAESCTVSLEGRTLTLSLDGKTCEPPAGTACSEACARNRVRCKVPPLDEGRYVVRYADTGGRVDSLDVVWGRDAAVACSLDDAASSGG